MGCSVCRAQFRYQGNWQVEHVIISPLNRSEKLTKVVDPSKFQFQHSCGMWAESIPAAIWKEYVRLKNKEIAGPLSKDEAQMFGMMTKVGGDNQHATQHWFEMPAFPILQSDL